MGTISFQRASYQWPNFHQNLIRVHSFLIVPQVDNQALLKPQFWDVQERHWKHSVGLSWPQIQRFTTWHPLASAKATETLVEILQNEEHPTGFVDLTWPKGFPSNGGKCDVVMDVRPLGLWKGFWGQKRGHEQRSWVMPYTTTQSHQSFILHSFLVRTVASASVHGWDPESTWLSVVPGSPTDRLRSAGSLCSLIWSVGFVLSCCDARKGCLFLCLFPCLKTASSFIYLWKLNVRKHTKKKITICVLTTQN